MRSLHQTFRSFLVGPCLLACLAFWGLFPGVAPEYFLARNGIASRVALAQEDAQDSENSQVADNSQSVKNVKNTKEFLTERTIYLTFDKFKAAFEAEGRGVFLPYEQFQALAAAAEQARKEALDDTEPPVPAMVADSVNELIVQGDIAQVSAKLRIVLFKNGWHQIPIQLKDAAIREAMIGREPAKILGDPANGYSLLIEKPVNKSKNGEKSPNNENTISSEETKDVTNNNEPDDGPSSEKTAVPSGKKAAFEPLTVELHVVYVKQIDKTPGRNDVAISAPMTPVNRWKVTIPEPGVKIDFTPLVAASEGKGESDETEKAADSTVVHAFIGPTPQIRIGWTPKSEGGGDLEAILNARMEQRVLIDEGVIRTFARIDYAISRSQVEKLAVRVPGDQKVAGLFDANVRQWTIAEEDGSQIIRIELFEPAKNRQQIDLELERILRQEKPPATTDVAATEPVPETISLPVIEPLDIGRLEGALVIHAAEGLALDTGHSTGLMQIDPNELPPHLLQAAPGKGWNSIYRLATPKYGLDLVVRKVLPEITAESQIHASLTGTGGIQRMTMNTVFNVEKAGVFQFLLDVPDGYTLVSVRGAAINGSQPAQVDTHHLGPETPDGTTTAAADDRVDGKPESKAYDRPVGKKLRRLTVNLSRKAFGRVGLTLRLDKHSDNEVLRDTIGKKTTLNYPFPNVAASQSERHVGRIVFTHADRYRVLDFKAEGLQPISGEQYLADNWFGGAVANEANRMGFAFNENTGTLAVDVEVRPSQTTIKQLQSVRIEEGVVRHRVDLNYTVRYNALRGLRVDLPAAVSGRIGKLDGFRDTLITPPPDDVPEGYVAWMFTRDSGLIGTGKIPLVWEDELPSLEVGKSVKVPVPRIIVPKNESGDRIWGEILLAKAPSINLGEGEPGTGLQAIDPQYDVEAQDRIADAVAAFRYHADWNMEILATRYRLEEVKRTSIETGLVQTVFLKNNDTLSSRALYRIRSVRQRLDLEMPTGVVFDDIRINGERITLESTGDANTAAGQRKRYLVPLGSVQPDVPFTLELRYTLPRRGGDLEIPVFPGERRVKSPNGTDNADVSTVPAGSVTAVDGLENGTVENGTLEDKTVDDGTLPAVQKMFVAAYLPFEEVPAAYGGKWSRLYRLQPEYGDAHFRTNNSPGIEQLVAEIGAGRVSDFPVDGNAYLFSTLQPERDDTLSLRIVQVTPLSAILFGTIVLLGVLLMFCGFYRRLQVLVLLPVIAAGMRIFCPTFMEFFLFHLRDVGGIAVLCVAVLWLLQGLRTLWKNFRWSAIKRFLYRPLRFGKKANADKSAGEKTPNAGKTGAAEENNNADGKGGNAQ